MIWFHKILKLVLKTAIMPQKYMYWSLKKTIYLSWQLSWTFTYTLSLRTMTILLNMCKKFCNAKSIPFQILHYPSLSWHITPLQILRSFLFYFGQKDLIKVPILTFSSALVKLSNFSSFFSNHKSVFLQNLHNSSVSWKTTPLYFCSSNNIYFGHKEPIKTQIF